MILVLVGPANPENPAEFAAETINEYVIPEVTPYGYDDLVNPE
jgi:hypothetical protein